MTNPKIENQKHDLNLRSEEVQEIMQRTPSWIVRWGITTIFGVIIMGLILCWLIKYPDIVTGSVKLTTSIPPVKIISQTSGNMTRIFVKDGQDVEQGTVLAEIQNPLSASGVKYIETYISALNEALMLKQQKLPIPDTTSVAFGDLQPVFNDLSKEIYSFNMLQAYQVDGAQLAELRQQLTQQQELLAINSKMLAIVKKELENATAKYEADKTLYENKVISKQEFFQNQTEYNNKQLQFEQLQQAKVQNTLAISSLKMQLSQSAFNKDSKYNSTLESIKSHQRTISSYLYGWQQLYRLVSLGKGKITYLNNLQVNQFLKAGEEVFALLQPGDSLIAFAEIPVVGFGKVEVGQEAHLLMENFPSDDYGVLIGKVEKIALLPNNNFYRVEISLTNGMTSSQGKPMKFTPDMIGIAEVVTDDKTVIERIFKSIIKLFKKN